MHAWWITASLTFCACCEQPHLTRMVLWPRAWAENAGLSDGFGQRIWTYPNASVASYMLWMTRKPCSKCSSGRSSVPGSDRLTVDFRRHRDVCNISSALSMSSSWPGTDSVTLACPVPAKESSFALLCRMPLLVSARCLRFHRVDKQQQPFPLIFRHIEATSCTSDDGRTQRSWLWTPAQRHLRCCGGFP